MGGERFTRIVPALYRVSGAARVMKHPAADPLFLPLFFAYKRLVEDPFAAVIRRMPELFRGGDVIDVGANAGYTSTLFGSAIDAGCRVHAFEPEPVNFRRLERVVRRRHLSERVTLNRAAVGSRSGFVDLWINPFHPGDHRVATETLRVTGETMRVPVVTLDEYVAEAAISSVRFVKIDVQGYELEVSRGMTRILESSSPVAVAFEFAPDDLAAAGADPAALLQFYRSRRFELSVLQHNGTTVRCDDSVIRELAHARRYIDVLATR